MYRCLNISVLNLVPHALALSWSTHFMKSAVGKKDHVFQLAGVSWRCRNHYWFAFVLWCG